VEEDRLVAVRAGDEAILLHTLRFHDEVVSGDELEIEGGSRKPQKREIDMANRLVDALAGGFKPDEYEDTYRDAVLDLIKRKAKGEEIDLVAEEEPEHGDDLMAALEASLSGARS